MQLRKRNLYQIPLISTFIFTIVAFIILEVILRNWYLERNELELSRVIQTTSQSIIRINAMPEDMQLIADNIGLVTSHYRITIASENGEVLGDSFPLGNNSEYINEPLLKPEFTQALNNGTGKSIRQSNAAKVDMLYLAKLVEYKNTKVFIRVAMNIQDYQSAVDKLRVFLVLMAIGFLSFMSLVNFAFVRLLSSTIKNEHALLENRVKERTQEILLLQRLASMLAACQVTDEVQNVVEDIVPRLLGNIPCVISLVNASRNLIEVKLHWGGEWPGEEVFNPEHCWALRKGRYHFSEDVLSSQKCHHMRDSEVNTLCIPLLAHGQTIGVFHIAVGENFSEEYQNIAFTLAEHIGLALANLNLQETLRNQASRDSLTGLYNRRYMEQALELELNRTTRHNSHCALLMIDVDYFKKFNDNYGHDAGDFVLKFLANLLIANVRKEDIVCRVGGEEISVILPATNAEQAVSLANKLCTLVSEQNLIYHDLALGNLTVSIGIGIFPNHGDNYRELVKAADLALYKVKHNGRNSCTLYELGI